ncbi:DUF4215 domain-containing protein [Nannocystis bainbridge]|uniref:Myxococcus cysteine-rich repeat-containing protein n=1 Tax=Nannocystis bainbridge TaxID=2995303 RepID=A0ABT5E9W3_9BACT|nr:DUF4215 domain-containing protein [Nannocystis bainbridge]MDC0722629.1 hypothetical protein [Nannocystis bainbridge]
MRRIALYLPLSAAIASLTACGDDAVVDTTASTTDTSTTDDSTSTSPGTTTAPTTGVPTTTDPTTTSTTTTTDTTDTTDTTTDSTSTTDTTTTTTDTTDTDTTDSSTTDASGCGDGVIVDPEVCDGAALADQDCISQGFDSGTLACADDCSKFDISGCVLASCGNGVLEGAEACDGDDLAGEDCISQGFEGGELTCMDNTCVFETSACFSCGDGSINGSEVCDGDELGGADCVSEGFEEGTVTCAADCGSIVTTECSTCGDNVLAGAELCDGALLGGQTCKTQGADFGTLKCSADCGFDLSACITAVEETEPNDDGMVATITNDFSAANANGPFSVDTLIKAKIDPVGDDDIFAVQNPGNTPAILRLETFSMEGPGNCVTIDTVVELRTAANTLLVSNDEDGIEHCSLISGYIMQPNETLYVRVIDFGDNTAITAGYLLDIQIDPVVCGDGWAGPGEQCDDGNLANGDGCSSACALEDATAEIEPNNTNALADANGIVSTGNGLFTGSVMPVGDLDRFRFDLAAPQFLRFESFSGLNNCIGATHTLRLYNGANTQIIADTAASGIAGCAALVFPLPAGTSYLHFEETGNNAVVGSYVLEARTLTDAGTETEPNETSAAANLNIQNGSDVLVYGDHSVATDSDYYRIDVPAGASLRLEIIEGNRAVETCESNGIDSRITLYNAQGVELANDDDSGRGFCSAIDGTGTSPLHAGAHNLAAGTYYAQVRASTLANGANAQFIYRLAATVRKP